MQRTVRAFERAGAAALQIEDQSLPKRCGHLAGKTLISSSEMAGKIRAACDARRDTATMIIARTDAIQVEGFAAALERAEAYVEAGADMLFVEAPRDAAQLAEIPRRFAERLPVMANMVEGGDTPMTGAGQLQDLGYAFVIFPGALVRRLAHVAEDFFAHLKQTGSTVAYADRMHDLTSLNELLDTPDFLRRGAEYDAETPGAK
jgi:2-methylisocitrate lyase-like PEP mutase family enzyme